MVNFFKIFFLRNVFRGTTLQKNVQEKLFGKNERGRAFFLVLAFPFLSVIVEAMKGDAVVSYKAERRFDNRIACVERGEIDRWDSLPGTNRFHIDGALCLYLSPVLLLAKNGEKGTRKL